MCALPFKRVERQLHAARVGRRHGDMALEGSRYPVRMDVEGISAEIDQAGARPS